MKRVAVLLYPQFSNYEMSVALSILGQAGKPFDVFALTIEPVRSEEGLWIVPQFALDAPFDIEQYDALLLTGELDCEPIATDPRYATFVRRFDPEAMVFAAISSAPVLLAKAGILQEHRYRVGIPDAFLAELGFDPEKNAIEGKMVRDGNILTAVGSGFVEFGVAYGEMLGLDFAPEWYGYVSAGQ